MRGSRSVQCVECGNHFITIAGNKNRCGDAKDKDSCMGQFCARRVELERKKPLKEVVQVKKEPPAIHDTPRLRQLKLIARHNAKVRNNCNQ